MRGAPQGGRTGEDGALAGDSPVDAPESLLPDLCAPASVLFTVLLTQLMALVFALAGSELPRFDWGLLATTSLFTQWVVLTSAALLCLARRPLARLGLVSACAASIALVLLVTLASSALASLYYPQSGGVWWVLRNGLIAVVMGGIVLRYFYLRRQLRLREQSEARARLESLRARIRPHFLFNTLNSIASLIEPRPADAERAVEDLAELLRAGLAQGARTTTVADELRLCEVYLDIERLRLGERLTVEWSVDDAVRNLPMPGLMLQPLLENAVCHGIARLTDGGTVRVSVTQDGGLVSAEVENPVARNAAQAEGHGMAVSNIRQRLLGLYGAAGSLDTVLSGDCYRVRMRYPAEATT